jgi:uncharacterized protein (UPF0261 family)
VFPVFREKRIEPAAVATVLVIGTLDTKGPEIRYLADRIRELGARPLVLDSGILGEPIGIVPDVTRARVAEAAGTTIDALRNAPSRGAAVEVMCRGVRAVALDLHGKGEIDGAVALGGAEGAVLAAAAMKALPIGVPKLVVSPIASGRRIFDPFVGTKDVLVMHSVVDILGLNAVSRLVFDNAAAAIAGMVSFARPHAVSSRPEIAVTMLGNTTRPIMRMKPRLEAAGFDPVVFHANGVGGRAMEELIDAGAFEGVLDYTLSEVAGEIAGGFHRGGPRRLEGAGSKGLPQVVVPACVDFIVFGAKADVPETLRDRPSYYHNPEFTLVHVTRDERLAIAREIARKLSLARGPVAVVVPTRGLSIPNVPGGPFHDPAGDAAFASVLRAGLPPSAEYREVDAHVNDDAFADAVFDVLLPLLLRSSSRTRTPD